MGIVTENCAGATIDPLAPVTTCYLHTFIPGFNVEPTTNAASVTGHEYLRQTNYTDQQFPSEGDAGGGLEGYHSNVVRDPDGVPAIPIGEATYTNVAAFAVNEGGVYGDLVTWEGAIYRPVFYHIGANAGKKVTKFEIYDAYTATNQSDHDEIMIGINGGQPSIDRSDLTTVAEGQVGTTFEIPASWAGEWTRLALIHGDKGNAAQVNWRVRLTLDDGTILQNQNLRDFVWNIETIDALAYPTYEQETVNSTYDPTTGLTTWTDAAGNTIDPNDLQQPIQEVECGYLPIYFEVTALPGSVTIDNAALGAGGPYEYSFDGGVTWQASNTLILTDTSDGTEPDIRSILPMVRDGDGITSAIKSAAAVVTDPVDLPVASLRVTDTINGENNNALAIESNNSGDPGGWVVDYGKATALDPDMTTLPIGGTGDINPVNANIMDFNRQTAGMGGINGTICVPGSAVAPGETGYLRFDLTNYYYGTAASDIAIEFRVEDVNGVDLTVDNWIIMDNDNDPGGLADVTWAENAAQNSANNIVTFTGNGEDVCLRIIDTSTGADAATHGWRMQNIEVFESGIVDAQSHFYRINNYIEARGVLRPEADPACLTRAVDDVSMADLVRLEGTITSAGGTWDNSGFKIEYSLDGGAWVELYKQFGVQWDVANQVYLTPYLSEGIDVSGASTLQARLCVWGDGDSTDIMRISAFDLSEIAP